VETLEDLRYLLSNLPPTNRLFPTFASLSGTYETEFLSLQLTLMRQILTVLFNQAFLAPSNRGFLLFSNCQRFSLFMLFGLPLQALCFFSNSECSLYPFFSGTVSYRLSS
jgi:hypothetical protein